MYVHRFVATEDRLDRRETLCFIIILFFNKNVKLKTEIYIFLYISIYNSALSRFKPGSKLGNI